MGKSKADEEKAEAAKQKGNELFGQSKIKEAIVQYDLAIKLNPDNPIYYSNRACAYTMDHQYAAAVKDAQRAIELNNGFTKAWLRLGVALTNQKEYVKAIDAFENAKQRCNENQSNILAECDTHIGHCNRKLKEAKKKEEQAGGEQKAPSASATETKIRVRDPDDDREEVSKTSDDGEENPFENRTMEIEDDAPPCCTKAWFWYHFNPGTLSNMIGCCIMILGFCLKYIGNPECSAADRSLCAAEGADSSLCPCGTYGVQKKFCDQRSCAYIWPLSAGLFAFAGGVTNAVAITMLFDELPGIYGSGIIPKRFKEIREVVKNVILSNFFNEEYLNYYLKKQVREFDAEGMMEKFLANPDLDTQAKKFLKENASGLDMMYPMFKPKLVGFAKKLIPLAREAILKKDLVEDLTKVKESVDSMLTTRMEELTPEKVKKLLEKIMREHLYWLVVWGNVFGAILGLISAATGLGS